MADQEHAEAQMLASSRRVRLYIAAIFALCFLVAMFVLGVTALRPGQEHEGNNLALIGVVLGIFAPVVSGLLAAALKENHDAMNSRLTQLLALTAKASKAEGKLGSPEEASTESGDRPL